MVFREERKILLFLLAYVRLDMVNITALTEVVSFLILIFQVHKLDNFLDVTSIQFEV